MYVCTGGEIERKIVFVKMLQEMLYLLGQHNRGCISKDSGRDWFVGYESVYIEDIETRKIIILFWDNEERTDLRYWNRDIFTTQEEGLIYDAEKKELIYDTEKETYLRNRKTGLFMT